MTAPGRGGAERVDDPRRAARPGRGVPREVDGRGRGELRRADGAVPRRRGDRPRRGRHRAEAGGDRGPDLSPSPAGSRPRTSARTGCSSALVEDLPSPAMRGGIAATADGERAVEIEPDEDGPLLAYVFKTVADPYTGPDQPLSRLPRHAAIGFHGRQRYPPPEGADRASSRQPLGKELRPVQELGAGDIGAVAKLKETQAGDVLCEGPEQIAFAAARPAGAGDGLRLRAEVEGRRGEGGGGGAALGRGGPDPRHPSRPADGRADHRRPDPGPRRGDSRPDEAPLRRRDRAASTTRALPGDDPRQRPRRTPATRSSPAAAASSPTARSRSSRPRTASGLEFVNKIKGGGDPRQLHPGGGEGGHRSDGSTAPSPGYPVKDVRVQARRRQAPRRRLLGDGLQGRRLDGLQAGDGRGRPGAAGADRPPHRQLPGGGRRRRHRRPQLAPRAIRWGWSRKAR